MALTATAPPAICACWSMNPLNISYHVQKLTSMNSSKGKGIIFMYILTSHQFVVYILYRRQHLYTILTWHSSYCHTSDQQKLNFSNFIKPTAPLAIALREHGLESTSYHGDGLSFSDKREALESWRNGQVMVCTSAFGMVIDQPDVEAVICVGCHPAL